jgi:hypothetical protein
MVHLHKSFVFLLCWATSHGLAAPRPLKKLSLSSAAIDFFRETYPAGRAALSLPIDGLVMGEKSVGAKLGLTFKGTTKTRRLPGQLSDKELEASFKEISKLYGGDENALKIVQVEKKKENVFFFSND